MSTKSVEVNRGPKLRTYNGPGALPDHSDVGAVMRYTHRNKEITGTVTDVRKRGMIENVETGKQWPGLQFRIKPLDGTRAFWTVTMPDRSVATGYTADELHDAAYYYKFRLPESETDRCHSCRHFVAMPAPFGTEPPGDCRLLAITVANRYKSRCRLHDEESV